MAFDTQAARKAGYSDDEIADYLSSQSGFDAAAARKAGYSSGEIIQAISTRTTQPANDAKPDQGLTPLDTEQVTSARPWQGAGAGRGSPNDPRRVDVERKPEGGLLNEARQLRDETLMGVQQTGAAVSNINAFGQANRLANTEQLIRDLEARGRGDSRAANQLRAEVQSLQERLPATIGAAADANALSQAASQMTTRPAIRKVGEAKTFGEAWEAFKESPYDVIAGVTAQSLPQVLPGLIAAAVTGPAAGAAAMGLNSGAVEFGGSLTEFAQDKGIDTRNAKAVQGFYSDPGNLSEALKYAGTRAGIIGTVDAASGGIAGKTLAPALRSPIKRQAINLPAQMAVQGAAGGGGEAGAQLATKGEIDQPGQVLLEVAGELGGAPAEVAAFTRDSARAATTPSAEAARALSTELDAGQLDPARVETLNPNLAIQRKTKDGLINIGAAQTVDEAIAAATQATSPQDRAVDNIARILGETPNVSQPGDVRPLDSGTPGLGAPEPGIGVEAGMGTDGAAGRPLDAGRVPDQPDRGAAPLADRGPDAQLSPDVADTTARIRELEGSTSTPEMGRTQSPEPASMWFGRRGDGYQTPEDASAALPSRQRIAPDLSWKVEQMPSGRYRLAGYDTQAQQPAPAFQVKLNPTGTATIIGDPAAIKATLAQAGIDKVMTGTDRVVVGTSQAQAAVQALEQKQPPALVNTAQPAIESVANDQDNQTREDAQAQAPTVETPAPEGSDAPGATAKPAAAGPAEVEAAGVEPAKAPTNRTAYVAEVRRQLGDLQPGDVLENDTGDKWTVDVVMRNKAGEVTGFLPREGNPETGEREVLDLDAAGSVLLPTPYLDASGNRKLSQPGKVNRAQPATPAEPQTEVPAEGAAAVEAAGVKNAGFDSEAWDKAREEVVKKSREAGNVHLDKIPVAVETMRGKKVYYAHDPKVRGTIRTVDNRGNVYINWDDQYSAEKELASPTQDGKKTVMQSGIGPRDLKDYVLATNPPKQDQTGGTPDVGAGVSQPMPVAAPDPRLTPVSKRNLPKKEAEQNTSAESEQVGPYGRDLTPIAQGGKPFKTKAEADKFRTSTSNTLKTVRSPTGKGFAVMEKSAAEILRAEKAAKRLSQPNTGTAGEPLHAHGFIAAEGGLSKAAMKDAGFDRNKRVGNRWMFSDTGMTIERATEKLIEAGYLRDGASHSDAFTLLDRSANQAPQYTPEGWERMAEAEQEARRLAAQDEANADAQDFAKTAKMLGESELDELDYAVDNMPELFEAGARLTAEEADAIFEEHDANNESAVIEGDQELEQADARAAPPIGGQGDRAPGRTQEGQGSAQEGLTAPTEADALRMGIGEFTAANADTLIAQPGGTWVLLDGRRASYENPDYSVVFSWGNGRWSSGDMASTPKAAHAVALKRWTDRGNSPESFKQASKDLFLSGVQGPDLLAAPTQADVLAQQDRAVQAEELDQRAQIDREASGFQLQTQTAEQRRENTGDMFGGPSVEDYQSAVERNRKPGTAPEGPDLFGGLTEQEATSEEQRIENLRKQLVDVEDKIVGAAGMAPGFIEDAMKSRKVPKEQKDRRNDLKAELRAARQRLSEQTAEPAKPAAEMSAAELLRAAADKMDGKAAEKKPADKIDDIGEKIGGARKDTAVSTGARKKAVSEEDDRPTWAKRFRVAQVAGGFDMQVNGRDITGKWTLSDTRTVDRLGQPKRIGGYFDSKEEAEAALPLLALAQKHRAVPVNTTDGQKYEIWRDINDRKRVKVVDRQFDTRDEAMRYMAQNAVQILETNTTFGEADLPKPESTQRIGVERRAGDVKGEDFRDTFGFRGVEFGLWNNQDERQEVMNAAYDGLLDLAEVLKVPPKAIGLNGDLALAFGARGKGLSGARAHYETDRVVMNLTKMNGAGALAHEWFHALDHYLARQDGKTTAEWKINKDGTRSLDVKGGESDMASSGFRRNNSGVREELRNAYTDLVQSLFTKAEQYVEDTARADKFVAVARGELEKDLSDLRKDLSEQKDVRYYKRNNKPASAEQLAEFDAMAAELVDGRGLSTEWKVMPGKSRSSIQTRHTNETLEKLNELYKAVRGRSGFNTERRGVLDSLVGYMTRYEQRLKMLSEATALTPKTKRVPTSFAMDAKSLDQGRGGDYWTSPHEMVARAFQGYVEDAIAANEGRSPFLNYAPENAGILTPWGAKRPFPAGDERKAMNAEFDKFIDVLQTRETDDGNVAMFSRTPAWRSDLRDKVAAIKMESSKEEGWRAYISGLTTKGVKPDEIEWSGVTDWLKLQTGKVTKQQVLDYLDGNGVQVQEVVLGAQSNAEADKAMEKWGIVVSRNPEDENQVAFLDRDNPDDLMTADELESAGYPIAAVRAAMEIESGGVAVGATGFPKYSQYTLPGGTNYREVLLTLPSKVAPPDFSNWKSKYVGGGEWEVHDADRKFRGLVRADSEATQEQVGKAWWEGASSNTQRMLDSTKADYRSSHWDTPNVLAHIRLNDRTDADGKRVLFVEEIQSDWGQEGKKKGFAPRDIANPTDAEVREFFGLVPGADPADFRQEMVEALQKRNRAGTLPAAPFVTSTDKWLTLALKRVITMASQEGYDKVAFVNGEQSAQRYSLSKQVDSVSWESTRTDGAAKNVTLNMPTGKPIRLRVDGDGSVLAANGPGFVQFEGKQLDDIIGKDLAKKIMGETTNGSLSGVGLDIGGEGMKAFYDKIIPNTLKDVLKKVGGGGLEAVSIGGATNEYDYFASQQGGFSVINGKDEVIARFQTPEEAAREVDRLQAKTRQQQPGFTITDTIREKAAQGLPMFRAGDESNGMALDKAQAIVKDLTKKWKNGPPVFTVATPKDLPVPAPSDANGMYFKGQLWIVAGAHKTRADIARTLAHEAIAHYGLRNILGADEWRRFMANIQLAIKSGNKPLKDIQARVRRAYVDDSGRFNLTANQEADEIAAKVVEDAIGPNGEFRPGFGFVKSVYARIVEFLRDLGLDVKLTMAEVQGMLVLAQRNLEAGRRTGGGGEVVVAASMRALDAPTLNSSTAATRIAEFRAKYPATPPSGMDIDAARAWLRDRRAAFDALVQELTPSADGLTLPVKSGGTWMVSREARPDGSEWRITRFDKNMEPQGHEAHNSAANAVADMVSWADVARLKDWQPEFSRTPQTDTQAFKSWFKGSKVVDAEGKPLVVYHSSTFGDFSTFDKAKQHKGMAGYGFYFSDADGANIYADYGANFQADKDWQGNEKKLNIMPVYLAIQNPLVADNIAEVRARFGKADPGNFGQGRKYGGMSETAQTAIQRAGYDGVIANEYVARQKDGSYKVVEPSAKGAIKHPVYVAFEPSQIKSATGNRGTFDRKDPDIRFSRGAVEEAPEQPPRPNMLARAVGYQSLDDAGSPEFTPGRMLYNLIGDATGPLLSKWSLKAASPELRTIMRAMKIDVAKAQETAAAVAKESMALSQEEREMVSDLIEKELRAGVVPPEHAIRLAATINTVMGKQTDELLQLGMLSRESAERWRGEYLPRFYESKLTKQADDLWADAMRKLRGNGKPLKGIRGKHLRGRGMYETIPVTQLADYETMGWEVRDPDYQPGLTDDGMVQVWRDFTRQERDKMGEIRDAGFRFVMGYMQTQKDIALGRMFEALATNPEMSSKTATEELSVHVPTGTAPGTEVKTYGKLAGRYVSPETLSQLSMIEEAQSEALMMYRKAMGLWKESKTVLNPVAHANNVISNITMAHFAGVSYGRVDKYLAAVRDFATKSDDVLEAKDAGLFLGTMNEAELFNTLPEELKALAQTQEGTATKIGRSAFNLLSFYLRKPMGWAYQAEDTFFRYLIYKDARGRGLSPDDAVDYAQKFIFTYDDLPQGARRVRDYGIPFFAYTYKAIPALLETALTHPERFAAPMAVIMAANAVAYAIAAGDDDDSWELKLKKYLNDPEYRKEAKAKEQLERELLPEWLKGKTALGTDKTVRLGTDELTKLPMFLDMSRMIPGGDLLDVRPNSGGVPWPQPLTPNHPLLSVFTAMFANKDTFYGKDIVSRTDTAEEAARKRMDWMWKQMTPAIAYGNYHWERWMNALAQATGKEVQWAPEWATDKAIATGIGRDGLPVQPKLAAMQTFGIKARPYDLDKAEEIQRSLTNKDVREIEAEMRSLRRLMDLGAVSDRTYDRKREAADEKKERLRDGQTVDGKPR